MPPQAGRHAPFERTPAPGTNAPGQTTMLMKLPRGRTLAVGGAFGAALGAADGSAAGLLVAADAADDAFRFWKAAFAAARAASGGVTGRAGADDAAGCCAAA